MQDLSSADYAFLIILRNEDREISNTEMDRLYGVRLVGATCMRLSGTYVQSDTTRSPYRHRLTERARKLLDEPLSIDDDVVAPKAKRSAGEKVLWAALVSTNNRQRPASPAAVKAADHQDRIRSAYDGLAARPGDWIGLARLRPLLADLSRDEQDGALRRLLESDDVRLEPEPHRHRLGDEDRAAAVRIGGEDRHKLAIGVR